MSLFDGNSAMNATMVSCHPKTVAYGESIDIEIVIENTTGERFTNVVVEFSPRIPSRPRTVGSTTFDWVYGMPVLGTFENNTTKAATWKAHESHTVKCSLPIKESAMYADMIDLPEYEWNTGGILATVQNEAGTTTYGSGFLTNGHCYIITKRDNPRVSFDVGRCTAGGTPSDEGTYLLTSLRLDGIDEATYDLHRYGYYLRQNGYPVSNKITKAMLFDGVSSQPGLISNQWSTDNSFGLTFTVTNGYESTDAYCLIPDSFANVHLSGAKKGGVAFGKFSASTDTKPMFECQYPAYLSSITIGAADSPQRWEVLGNGFVSALNAPRANGRWVDGKPLYTYVVPISVGSGKSSFVTLKESTWSSTNLEIDKLIDVKGYLSNGDTTIPLGQYCSSVMTAGAYLSSSYSLGVFCGMANMTGYAALLFTLKKDDPYNPDATDPPVIVDPDDGGSGEMPDSGETGGDSGETGGGESGGDDTPSVPEVPEEEWINVQIPVDVVIKSWYKSRWNTGILGQGYSSASDYGGVLLGCVEYKLPETYVYQAFEYQLKTAGEIVRATLNLSRIQTGQYSKVLTYNIYPNTNTNATTKPTVSYSEQTVDNGGARITGTLPAYKSGNTNTIDVTANVKNYMEYAEFGILPHMIFDANETTGTHTTSTGASKYSDNYARYEKVSMTVEYRVRVK